MKEITMGTGGKGPKALFQSMKTNGAIGKPDNMVQGSCPYCLDKDVNVIYIGCAHLYCAKCCMNLIKITKIKKGLNFSKMEGAEAVQGQTSVSLQVIKCPKCA